MLQITPDYDYTLKNYYYPDKSDDEDQNLAMKVKQNITKRSNKSIDAFFEKAKKKKTVSYSSSVGQSNGEGTSYISTNCDDGSSASHLVKIEVYEMNRLKQVSPIDYWKHADVRVKYYVATEEDKHYQTARDLIYNVTKQVASKPGCTKFFVTMDKKQ